MIVRLLHIEKSSDGSPNFYFVTDAETHFARDFSFNVPVSFASKVEKFVKVPKGMKLDISIIPLSNGKQMMEFTRYDPCNLSETKKVFRLSSYTLDK